MGTRKGEVVNHIICVGSEMSSSLVSPLDCGDDSDYFASDLQNHVIAVISSDCLFCLLLCLTPFLCVHVHTDEM